METTLEGFCNLIVRSRLLTDDAIPLLRKHWLSELGGSPFDPQRFARWLMTNQYVTEYQAGLLLRGYTDHYFLDDYKLLDRIGKGRMAGVYKAVNRQGQVYAIKVLPPSKVKHPESFGRFQREARLAMRLRHPNVVRAFQLGDADGIHYLVMEYLEGETLEEVLQRRRKLPPAEAVRLVHQALLALQHLHEEDLVHRDIMPGNLMLVPGRIEGQPDTTLEATVKLLDIGLGRALFDEGDPTSGQGINLTVQGAILGAPDYMAPEQALDAHAADIRSDIYGVGCVLYHGLAGQPPFPGTNLVRKMVGHARETPPPVKGFTPTIPDGLQRVLDQMLAKDPARRFPTPEKAADALEEFLPGRSEAAIDTPPKIPFAARPSEVLARTTALRPETPKPLATPPAAPVPLAQPLSAAPPPRAAAPAHYASAEVEPAPAVPAPAPARSFSQALQLTRRESICLGVGAVGALLAEGAGWLVAKGLEKLVHRSPEGDSKPSSDGDKKNE
jgi:serine/threonine protein kinase